MSASDHHRDLPQRQPQTPKLNDLLGPLHALGLIPSRLASPVVVTPVLLRGRYQRLHVAFFFQRDCQLLDERLVLVLVQTLAPAVLTGHMLLDATVEGAEGAPGPVATLDEGLALAGQCNGFILEVVSSVVAWIGAEMEFALSQAVASGDAFEHRPSECGHCVQNFLADLDFRDLPGEAAGFELGSDDALPTADLCFYPAALVVPCG